MSGNKSPDTRVFVSDIDGTLLEDGERTPGLELLRASLSLMNDRVSVVYATGRTFDSTWQLVERGVLPLPDAIAPLVGTEVWFPPWRSFDREYSALISKGWDRRRVFDAVNDVPGLKMQPCHYQSEWKLSFFVKDENSVEVTQQQLTEKDIDARIVYSGSRFLDLLSPRSGKLPAIEFILDKWKIPREQTIACGDSGNDADMLSARGIAGVVVGNAESELLAMPATSSLYFADYTYAEGVLEGTKTFDFWPSY